MQQTWGFMQDDWDCGSREAAGGCVIEIIMCLIMESPRLKLWD